AIELDFIQPVALGGLAGQGGELGRQGLRERCFAAGFPAFARPLVAGRFSAGGSALACRLCRRSRLAWSGRAAGHPLAGGVDQGLGQYTFRPLGQDIVLPRRAGFPVPLLDQQPLLLVAAATPACAHQCPVPGQFLADQGELELAVAVGLCRIPVGLPDAAFPVEDITAAVLPPGTAALELSTAQAT